MDRGVRKEQSPEDGFWLKNGKNRFHHESPDSRGWAAADEDPPPPPTPKPAMVDD